MRMKSSTVSNNRAWKVLRLALLWTTRCLARELRILPKSLKTLAHGNSSRDVVRYGERELSFDDTPIFRVKMHRPGSMRFRLPHIPCINPRVDFHYDHDFDFDDEANEGDGGAYRKADEARVSYGEEGSIDSKAEKFIATFHEQMKLQRQISYLQYNEMLNRSTR